MGKSCGFVGWLCRCAGAQKDSILARAMMDNNKKKKNHVVLSIDVGIRNLACCKAVVGGSCGGIVEILEWTVLDLAGGGGEAATDAAAMPCAQCAGRKRPFQAAFAHAAHPPLCGPHARKIEGMFFPLPVISAAARKRKRQADAKAQAAAFLEDGVDDDDDDDEAGGEEETTAPPVPAAAAAPDATETAIAEQFVVTKSALTSMSLPELRQFAARHRGFASAAAAAGGWTAPLPGASKTLVLTRMLEHMTSHTWRRTGDAAEAGGVSAAKMSVVDAGMRFAVEAQRLQLFAGVDELIVENQIGTISARMKSMQDVISCMAVFAGVPKVRAVSAATKLGGFDGGAGQDTAAAAAAADMEDDDEEERAKKIAAMGRAKYQSRKAEGVARCRAWLAAHPVIARPWLAAFERTKKKDDMADSLLQLLGQLRE